MKILHIIPHFYPAFKFGGPVTLAYALCRKLVEVGHEVTVYTTDAGINKAQWIMDNGQTNDIDNKDYSLTFDHRPLIIKYFPNISEKLAAKYNLYFTPYFYPVIIRKIKYFDIVHIHEFYVLQNAFAAYLAGRNKIPFVFSAHGSLIRTPERGKDYVKRLFESIFRNAYLKADAEVALTEAEKADYEAYGFDKSGINVIPSGADKFEKADKHEVMDFYQKFNINPKDKIILFLGRLHKIKRIDLIIKSFAQVREKINNAYLVIAGPDDGEAASLKELAVRLLPENSYTFTGQADENMKRILLSVSSLFMLTSISEGLSQSILECLSAGIPGVITKSCNFPDMAKYKCGFTNEADEAELSDTVIKILKDRSVQKRMGINGMKLVRKKYSWERIIDEYEKLYWSLI